jgi:hypothetical protein
VRVRALNMQKSLKTPVYNSSIPTTPMLSDRVVSATVGAVFRSGLAWWGAKSPLCMVAPEAQASVGLKVSSTGTAPVTC